MANDVLAQALAIKAISSGGGTPPANMMTTNTDQTVSAKKTLAPNAEVKLSQLAFVKGNSTGVNLVNIREDLETPRWNIGDPDADIKIMAAHPITFFDGENADELALASSVPTTYIREASVDNKTLTLTKQDFSTLTFTDTGSVVSGTNDGTNWSTITIDGTTKNIPSGGGSSYSAGTGIDITNNVIKAQAPVISIQLSQVISQNPITIQLTDEQYATIADERTITFEFDLTGLGMGKNYWVKTFVNASQIALENSYVDRATRGKIVINTSKQAVYSTEYTVYSAGNGINIAGNTFSADTSVMATKSYVTGIFSLNGTELTITTV